MNELYECTSEGSDCFQKGFDDILFSSSLQVIPKEVFLIAILLCPRSSRETQGLTVRAFHSHSQLKIDVCKLENVFGSMCANRKY